MTGRPETLTLISHLKNVQGEAARQAIGQLFPYFILFIFPMMWTKHDYMLPLTWMVVPILGFKITLTVDSKMKSSGSNTTLGASGGTFGSKTVRANQTVTGNTDNCGSYITEVGTYNPGTEDGDAYELRDGKILSGAASLHDMDSVNLNDKGQVVAMSTKNPSFTGDSPQDIVPSGV
jgi:hypothetical protein